MCLSDTSSIFAASRTETTNLMSCLDDSFGSGAKKIAVSSTKSMTGHLLGASGGIEFVASVMALNTHIIPPTINYEDPDPECTLDYTPNNAVEKKVDYAMSNSFGFGGHNAVLIVKKYEPSETDS